MLTHIEEFFLWYISLEHKERVMLQEHGAGYSRMNAGGVVAVRVVPAGHVGEVCIAEIDASDVVGTAVCVEESPPVSHREIEVFLGGDDIAVEEPAEVRLQGVDADFGSGAGVGMLGPMI